MRTRTALAIATLLLAPAVGALAADPPAPAKPQGARPAAAAKPAGGGSDRFHLKPGAKGKACLGCHATFADTLKQPFVHTPVKNGDCSDCHDPHASDHGKLLEAEPSKICVSCHGDVVPAKAESVHANVVEGNCTKCHDPHGSANKGNLLKGGNELCFGCHADLAKSVAEAKFKHPPVAKSCLTCHSPHAGETTKNLLLKASPAVCVSCHNPDQPAFQKAHLNYPVARGDCGSCHDPHGSSQPSLLWATVHMPVKNRMCAQCHYDASSPQALATKKSGLEVCKACHSETVNTALGEDRIHWPVVDRKACLNCHRPHASRVGKLLKAEEKSLCGGCHGDAVARQARSATKHEPILEGNCTICHRPHSSPSVFLFDGATVTDVCEKCHEWQKHSAHPIGTKVVDPRNRNLTLDCLSCHRTHGTPNKHLTHFDTKKDLCVQCHVEMGM